jgi:hypothetical protein
LTVYNITDGICATDISGWFSRWLLYQKISCNSTTLTIGVLPASLVKKYDLRWAAGIGITISSSMIVLASLINDWWGLVNGVALAVSVAARYAILKANRDAIDLAAIEATEKSSTLVKTIWRLQDGSSLVVYTSRGILTECLLSRPRPLNKEAYSLYKMLGWVAFFAHALSLGMATLSSQLLCVVVLAVSTLCTLHGLGCRYLCMFFH